MTQQELADKLQITNRAVSKWEKGDGLPDISMLTPLAAYLSVSVDELLIGEAAIIIPSTETPVNTTVPPVYHHSDRFGLNRLLPPVLAFGLAVAFSYDKLREVFFGIFCFFADRGSNIQELKVAFPYAANSLFWICTSIVLLISIRNVLENAKQGGKAAAILALLFAIAFIILYQSSLEVPMDRNFVAPSLGIGMCSVLIVFHGYKAPFKILYFLVFFGSLAIYSRDIFDGLTNVFPFTWEESLNLFFERQAVPTITFMMFLILYGLSFRRISGKRSLQEV